MLIAIASPSGSGCFVVEALVDRCMCAAEHDVRGDLVELAADRNLIGV
jgi:hypothetical protein